MKRIIVIGCPGSGKSTFARKLRDVTNLPLYHLDMMYWNEDKTTVKKDDFIKELKTVLGKEEWIIDGNYASTMEMRMKECDTVFFLDYSKEVCLEGIQARQGKPRSDMPWVGNDSEDKEFIEFIKNYNEENKPKVMALIEKYRYKNINVFHSRREAEEFLLKY